MLHSVAAHRGGLELVIHYLHAPGLVRRDRAGLERAVGGALDFIEIADERVAHLPVREYFTAAMWYRLLLPELLEEVDRVLYLDVDTLARRRTRAALAHRSRRRLCRRGDERLPAGPFYRRR